MIERRRFLKLGTAAAAALATAPLFGCVSRRARHGDDVLDVVVIGAGFSGLVAARLLAEAGVTRLAVLEARDRVGGRVYNQQVDYAHPVEMGAAWVGPGQWAVIDLAQELGLALRPQFNQGDTFAIVDGRPMRVPTTASPITNKSFMRMLDTMARTVPVEAPWTAPRAAEWDATTYADQLATMSLSDSDRATVTLATMLTYGARPEALSFLYVLAYIRAAGGFARLESVEGGAQESRIVGGTQTIALAMASQLGAVVRLSSPVSAIRRWNDARLVEIDTPKGTIKARRVVMALSPSQAAGISFEPALPASKAGLIAAWPTSGSAVKAFASYETPFWRKKGLSGNIYDFGGVFSWAADASPDDGAIGVLGTLALSDPRFTPEQRQKETLAAFAKCFGPQALRPTAYVEFDWSQDAFTRGCVSPLEKGVLTRHGAALRESTGRLSWAGTETATIWTGYMDGAVRAGRRAAVEALAAFAAEA